MVFYKGKLISVQSFTVGSGNWTFISETVIRHIQRNQFQMLKCTLSKLDIEIVLNLRAWLSDTGKSFKYFLYPYNAFTLLPAIKKLFYPNKLIRLITWHIIIVLDRLQNFFTTLQSLTMSPSSNWPCIALTNFVTEKDLWCQHCIPLI